MTDTFKFVQVQPFTLAGAGAIIGDTSITLSSFQDIDGNNLAMTDFGSIGFGTLEPGNGTLEEQISFSGVTQNANGTATLTGVMSVGFTYPYTETSGLTKTHAGASSFVISNTSGFYDRLTAKADDETITGTWTFTNPNYPRMDTDTPFPTDNEQLATKAYADSLTFAGAPNASETQKGISQLPTRAQMAAGTSAGSTGARMVIPTSLATATGASGTTVAVISQTNGTIAPAFIDQTGSYAWTGTLNSFANTTTFAGVTQLNATTSIAGTVSNKVNFNSVAYVFPPIQGTTSSFLMNDGSGNLTWNRSVTSSNGVTTRTGDTASGTQTIAHGLGVFPRQVHFSAKKLIATTGIATSEGDYNGTTNSCVYDLFITAGTNGADTGSFVIQILDDAGGTAMQTAVATYDATNITLTWVKTGTPSSNVIRIEWNALA